MAKRRKKRPAPRKARPKARPAPKRAKRRAAPRKISRRLRRDGRGRLRDYRKEYKRRVKIEALRDLEQDVVRDARRLFGRPPKREKGDDDGPSYELRLAELAREDREGRFEWLDEGTFIAQMIARGADRREAYTLWFSP